MKKIILPSLSLLFSFMFLLAPNVLIVNAQINTTAPVRTNDAAQDGLNDIGQAFPNRNQPRTVQQILKMVIDWALYLAAITAVIFIIIGGYFYITSAGNSAQATKGRDTLVNALIGLAMVVLSYIIVQIVYNFLVNKQ